MHGMSFLMQRRSSSEVLEIHHGQLDLSGEIDQRKRECSKGNNEQESDAVFMREVEKRDAESHDQKQRGSDAAGDGPHDRSTDQFRPRLQTKLVLEIVDVGFG